MLDHLLLLGNATAPLIGMLVVVKLAKYYDANRSGGPYEWEMYDLETDPLETKNLAYKGYKRTKKQQQEYERLRKHLAAVERKRLQPLA